MDFNCLFIVNIDYDIVTSRLFCFRDRAELRLSFCTTNVAVLKSDNNHMGSCLGAGFFDPHFGQRTDNHLRKGPQLLAGDAVRSFMILDDRACVAEPRAHGPGERRQNRLSN